MLIAVTIGTVAFFLDVVWLVWASAALLLVGAIVGWVLARAGYGVGGAKVAREGALTRAVRTDRERGRRFARTP